MKKRVAITMSIVEITALLLSTRNDTIDLTNKLPLITSFTSLTGEFLEGGSVCLQFTTVIPDKFSATTRMYCKKRV